jgi:hypothetical protein
MKQFFSQSKWTVSLVTFSCLGMLMGQLPAWAFGPSQQAVPTARPATPITDVTLDETGRLVGQVVDDQGQSRDGVLVVLRQGHREIARTLTRDGGHFAMANVPAGLYQLDADSTRAVYRIWNTSAAPPQASDQAVLVAPTDPVVRGQHIESVVDQLDAITLVMVASSVTALIIAGATYNKIDDLEDQIDALGSGGLPCSP